MRFEYDEAKRARLLRERGVDILVAARILNCDPLTRTDTRRHYGEERYVSVGMSAGELYVVVHTKRGDATRLITAWRGGRRLHEIYQAYLAGKAGGAEPKG
ncbi:BrnT family toxin [Salinarimonas rosea]|uniref:BrnT family toxin n=1 Tax=Salinarimonas rosea TaxID=552063 RepID=UPI00048BA2DE|nr:BrnT family toxin [Salinarimonas rosea]